MSAGAAVELDRVSKRYETPAGVIEAVDGVSLAVAPGASLAITGPSGCGKSTLLGLIGGLDPPTAGRVSLGGREISRLPERERDGVRRHEIGFVFQSDNLLPFLTATENVLVQCSLNGEAEALDRSRALLAQLGLAAEVDAYPDQLSGGQRQRVAVARALVHEPSLIVADEPTGSLDAETATAALDLLLEAQRASGATLVLVTHEPTVAGRLERKIGMRDGRIADGSAAARAKAEPATPGSPRA
ncbi:MAG: ABC transporter ATP-binding protein [Actinomycetota bacterium]|nr:ABC transporter ATP-binding protein [Actinomycetota bacterium]